LFSTMSFPEIYERVLVGPLFRPFAEQLVTRLHPRPGESLIDVACGTGIVARIARERLGQDARVVGVDIAPPMLTVARTMDARVEWREGNATALPVGGDERFNLLTCHQGLQFVPDKALAVAEMRRVLAADGRVAIGVWHSLHDLPAVRALNALAEQHIGTVQDSRHSFGSPDALVAVLRGAGFRDVRVESVSYDVRFPDGLLFARLNAMAVIGMSEKGKGLGEPERADLAGRIAVESQDLVARHTRDGAFVLPLAMNLAIAHL
jgi:ubiquinone/menaquinone biosynthesis C-methylase UbiE